MNSLRIRAVLFTDQFGRDPNRPYAVQVSDDGLVWWTMGTYGDADTAKAKASELEAIVKLNQLMRVGAILCSLKI